MSFPDGFWWGSGASSTQTEGSAPASDYRAWEEAGKVPPSGDGNGFATRYAEDFALLASLGLTHHRLSIEWARIEPEPGKRDVEAIEHYRLVLQAARDAGIAPWVCLHHFSLPGWFSHDERGFLDERSRSYYWPRHVDFVAEAFGDLVFGWKPVNEPIAYALFGWQLGMFPPGVRDRDDFHAALEAIHLANVDAALRLRQEGQPVATVHNVMPMFPHRDDPALPPTADAEVAAVRTDDVNTGCWIRMLREGTLKIGDRPPVEVAAAREAFDLVGFSYYFALAVRGDGALRPYPGGLPVGPQGYVQWADGLGIVLHRLAEELPDLPIVVAEYGMGTTDDTRRETYLRDGLAIVEEAVAGGIDVRGFFHWTGIDNYEWSSGFRVPFGLLDRDRIARPSAALASAVALGGPVPSA